MIEKSLRVLEYYRIIEKLAGFASSSRARNNLLNIKPVDDVKKLEKSLSLTEEAYKILSNVSSFHVGAIMDISEYLRLAEIGSVLSSAQLLETAQTLRTARFLSDSVKKIQKEDFETPLLMEISGLIGSFTHIENAVFSAIISENEISDNASKKLFSIRRSIEKTKLGIRNKLDEMISSQEMQKYLQDSIVTIRGDRFVIPVKSEHKSQVEGLVHDKSKGGATFYIEPSAVVSMNNELRSLMIDEEDEIRRILLKLTEMIAESVYEIRLSYDSVCELDYTFAKGKLALEMNAARPIISEAGRIKIKQGRHPFIKKEDCVPIDFEIGENYNAVIITGPNTGGKTVSIKTVALLNLIALSGLFVPALYGSEFGLFSNVMADIGDEQSIDQSLSTFSSHMQNIVKMVDKADKKTLLLFDELGAGTDPTEGAALAISILKTVQKKGATIIATTHYSELKEFALVTEGFQNASVEFDVEKLSPTYRLSIGVPGKSNAFEISRRLGLNENIIENAQNLLKGENVAFEDVLAAIEEQKSQAENERKKATDYRLKNEKLLKELEIKESKIEEIRVKTINEAKIEARRIIASAKSTMEETLKDLKKIDPALAQSAEALKIKQRLSEEDNKNRLKIEKEKEYNDEIPENFNIGETYYVISIGKNAVLTDFQKDNDEVTVKVGVMKFFVKKSELRISSKRAEKKKTGIYDPKNTLNYGTEVNFVKSSKTEIDLHGKDVLQALHELDKFLDESLLSGLNQLSVIHGLGSGILKQSVQDFLKKHPLVKKIRGGVQGEGGAGVTIVTLK